MRANAPLTDDTAAASPAEAGVAGDADANPVVAFEGRSDDASAAGASSDAPARAAAELTPEGIAREPVEAELDPTAAIVHAEDAEDAEDAPVAAREPSSGPLERAEEKHGRETPTRKAAASGSVTGAEPKTLATKRGTLASSKAPARSASARPAGAPPRRSRHPWNDPPPGAPSDVRPFYEHLAPSRWRDARLSEARRDAQSARLFADAVRRREARRAAADAPVPRTRWSGRLPASRLEEGFERIAGDAAAFVERRAAIALPDRPTTGTVRYFGSHDEFRGELEPAPAVPEAERVANLVKQFYGETAKRAVHRAERYEHYLSALRPISARERELLKLDETPVVPMPSEFAEIAERELEAARALAANAKAKIREERVASAAAARSYKAARAESEEAKTRAMRARLRSAREERAAAERVAAEARAAKVVAEKEKAEALESAAAAQKAEMHEKFAKLAAARRAEVAEGDAKRAALEAERAVLKRKEMKALWEKQKAREAKYAEMMSADNDAGSALVMEGRAHRRSVDEARAADRERRAAAKKEERKANREKVRAYEDTVAEMEARLKEKQAEAKKELRKRAAALEAEAKKRRQASEEARRAERRARGELTPPKRKKKRRPKSRGSDTGVGSPPESGEKGGSRVGDENAAPAPNTSAPAAKR